MTRPVFGLSNERVGTLVVMDTGAVLMLVGNYWYPHSTIPGTVAAYQHTVHDIEAARAVPDRAD